MVKVNGNEYKDQEAYNVAVKESTDKAERYCKGHKLKAGTDKYSIAFRNVFNLWMFACAE